MTQNLLDESRVYLEGSFGQCSRGATLMVRAGWLVERFLTMIFNGCHLCNIFEIYYTLREEVYGLMGLDRYLATS